MKCCRSVVKANPRDREEATGVVLQKLHALLSTAMVKKLGR